MALQNSAVSHGADARVQEMAAKLRGASIPQNAILSIAHGVGQNTGGLDEDFLATQVLEIGDKHTQRVRGAKAERDAALADRADKVAGVEFNTRSAYFAALRSEAEYKLASGALETAKAFLNTAQIQFQAGDVPRSNVLRGQIELARAEQGLAAAESDRGTKFSSLKSLVGGGTAHPYGPSWFRRHCCLAPGFEGFRGEASPRHSQRRAHSRCAEGRSAKRAIPKPARPIHRRSPLHHRSVDWRQFFASGHYVSSI
jgi:hypothetical protein